MNAANPDYPEYHDRNPIYVESPDPTVFGRHFAGKFVGNGRYYALAASVEVTRRRIVQIKRITESLNRLSRFVPNKKGRRGVRAG
jgi:hypothetical protein